MQSRYSVQGMASFCVLFLGTIGCCWAQSEPIIKVEEIADQLFLLSTDQGSYTTNSLAFVGDDGVLLVDTQASDYAQELKKVVDGFGKGLPRFIINTHRHVEHVGGNAIFGPEPVVIAHELVRKRLRQGSYLFEEFPDETFADIDVSDQLTLHFNGEVIELRSLAGSHDDNEIMVHFTGLGIVHLSSIVNGFNFPSVDADGDVLAFADCVAQAMQILPHDVKIVSGHNGLGHYGQLSDYHDMLRETAMIVKKALKQGKLADQIKSEGLLNVWKPYAKSYVSVEDWVDYLVEGIQDGSQAKRKSPFEPLYYAWKEGGSEKALAVYKELKAGQPQEYDWQEYDLWAVGSKLVEKGQVDEGIPFFRKSLSEYPDGKYTYYCHYLLAQALKSKGDQASARKHAKLGLELKPENEAIKALLQELQ